MAAMEREILNLHQANDAEKLTQLLETVSDNEVAALISNRASRGRGEVTSLVQALISASPSDSDTGLQRRLLAFKQCISLLQANSLSSKIASELTGFLLLEVDCFPSKSLAELADLFVDAIKNGVNSNGKSLELFAKFLSALDVRPSVSHGGDEMSGSEFKDHLLNGVTSCRWQPEQVLLLVTMFRDVPLSDDQLRFVLTKALRRLNDIELQEIPPLVYQLLALTAKGHKRLVLEGLSEFFTKRDKQLKTHNQSVVLPDVVTATDELKHVEGTAVLHVAFAAKQDQDLAREIIKYLKACSLSSSSQVLAPFNVAIALSIARIHRFEDQVFDLLKSSILTSYRDAKRRADSHWVRQTVTVDTHDRTLLLLETVNNSIIGCDHVMQGLVQLGFLLMDAFGPKAVFGKIADDSPPQSAADRNPGQRSCDLGALILFNTFKTHELVRKEIIEQILNRVVTKATAPVSHYIALLSRTVMSSPQILLDSLPKLREAFDYLSLLPLVTADGLLQAMRPLLKISASLRDALILVLKKAIFSRQLESRRTAVSGFLLMLRSFKVLGGIACSQPSQSISLSQVTVDVHRPYNPASNEALCLEIIGNLRRCLTQQADVRLTLYQGLYEVLCCNSQLSNPVLGLLLLQFKKYYLSDEQANPPLCLDACVTVQGSDVFLAEPLAHLIACIGLCVLKIRSIGSDRDEEEEDGSSAHAQLANILASLMRRMTKCEPEDFELDKAADYSQTTTVGIRNTIYTLLIGSIYEALFEYNLSRLDDQQSIYEESEQLFRSYVRVTDMLKDKGGGGAGNRKKGAAGGKGKSMLSLQFLASLLHRLFSDDNPLADVLRQNADLVRYVVGTTLHKVQAIADRGRCDGADGSNPDKVFLHLTTIARAMLSEYRKKTDNRQLSLHLLEGFVAINNIVCTRYVDKLATFLSALDAAVDDDDTIEDSTDDVSLQRYLKFFQRLVVTAMSSDEDDHRTKETSTLLTVITAWCRQLSPGGAAMTDALGWTHRLCSEQTPDDVALAKSMISLLIQLTSQQKNCAPLLRDLACDLHTRLGDIDQDVEMDNDVVFGVITGHTAAPPVLYLVTSQLERELTDCDWTVSRLKCLPDGRSDTETDTHVEKGVATSAATIERSVCTELAHCINAMHELAQTAVATGACSESLLHTLTRLYNSLTHLTKYCISRYQQKSGHLSSRYEKLVKLSGTNLTQYVYATITYIQACQSETAQANGDRAKRKKKNDAQGKARAMKETRSIPNLIFAIEQYERYLIQLSKKSKINLMEHFKLSTSRDFRINAASLQAALEPQSSEDEGEAGEEGVGDGNNIAASGIAAVEAPAAATSSGKKQSLGNKKSFKKLKLKHSSGT